MFIFIEIARFYQFRIEGRQGCRLIVKQCADGSNTFGQRLSILAGFLQRNMQQKKIVEERFVQLPLAADDNTLGIIAS